MAKGIAIQNPRLERMKPDEVLFLLGGLLAVLLGAIFFAIQWSQGIPSSGLPDQLVVLVVDVVVGIFLWIALGVARRSAMSAGIMGVTVSFVLMIFGGLAGLVGGVVGFLGGLLAIALPYLGIKE